MPLDEAEVHALVDAARTVRGHAYAPYSGFAVGAALLAEDGRVFAGVNVENSAYPVGTCAERTAIGAAVSAGVRRFRAIAIVCAPSPAGALGAPCGMCRQALSEFAPGLEIVLSEPDGDRIERHALPALLPHAFGPESL